MEGLSTSGGGGGCRKVSAFRGYGKTACVNKLPYEIHSGLLHPFKKRKCPRQDLSSKLAPYQERAPGAQASQSPHLERGNKGVGFISLLGESYKTHSYTLAFRTHLRFVTLLWWRPHQQQHSIMTCVLRLLLLSILKHRNLLHQQR